MASFVNSGGTSLRCKVVDIQLFIDWDDYKYTTDTGAKYNDVTFEIDVGTVNYNYVALHSSGWNYNTEVTSEPYSTSIYSFSDNRYMCTTTSGDGYFTNNRAVVGMYPGSSVLYMTKNNEKIICRVHKNSEYDADMLTLKFYIF